LAREEAAVFTGFAHSHRPRVSHLEDTAAVCENILAGLAAIVPCRRQSMKGRQRGVNYCFT